MFPDPTQASQRAALNMDRTKSWVIETKPLPSSAPSLDSSKIPRLFDPAAGTDLPCPIPLFDAPALTFVRRRGRFRPEKQVKLRNSLLAAIGLIELANAGDFPANVWNMDPLPIYAIVLMVMGGTLALTMIYFVFKDAILSWQNLCGLRAERRYLWRLRQESQDHHDNASVRTVDCFLHVNFREIGTEVVDRFGMDTLMGFGAFAVGVGTYMAIGGSNPKVFLASNLLTGYIGNSPCALYGLVNLTWSGFVWVRARHHTSATLSGIKGTKIEHMMKIRAMNIKIHSLMNGVTGIVAGAASLATYTHWWAYIILLPCLATFFTANIFFRKRVGYDRPYVQRPVVVDEDSLIAALRYASLSRLKAEGTSCCDTVTMLLGKPASLPALLSFITKNSLFEDFCIRLFRDAGLVAKLFPETPDSVTVHAQNLATIKDEEITRRILVIANEVVNEEALNCFKFQERWLLEALGCYMAIPETQDHSKERAKLQTRRPRPRNAHTDCGRYTNNWLFGGFSVRSTVRGAVSQEKHQASV